MPNSFELDQVFQGGWDVSSELLYDDASGLLDIFRLGSIEVNFFDQLEEVFFLNCMHFLNCQAILFKFGHHPTGSRINCLGR